MTRVEVQSYQVSIFIAGSAKQARATCRDCCDQIGLCVTVTSTTYCFTGGEEAGVIVGLINYPRFPKSEQVIWEHAEALAERLCIDLGQQSYTIQAPDKTVWTSYRGESD